MIWRIEMWYMEGGTLHKSGIVGRSSIRDLDEVIHDKVISGRNFIITLTNDKGLQILSVDSTKLVKMVITHE